MLTTASPGASARIGLGTVPPALTVPRPVTPGGTDPIPALPGLLGYYQADALLIPVDSKTSRAPYDGEVIKSLTGLGPAKYDGGAVGAPAIFERGAVNARGALRFVGGWYSFPQMRGTTGAATLFLVTKGTPIIDTLPGRVGALRQLGGLWQLVNTINTINTINAVTAGSDTDWAVYTARYTAGPKRVLDLWANGHRYDSRRRDNAGDVQFGGTLLGTVNNSSDYAFTGLLSTAVIVDGGLPDDQVDLVNRFLIHQHGIAV